MACLSEKEMENVVAERCAAFGPARKVTAYLDRKGMLKRPFALVDMETASQAEGLAAAFGRRTMGNAVVIVLQKEQVDTPTLLPVRSSAPAVDRTYLKNILKPQMDTDTNR